MVAHELVTETQPGDGMLCRLYARGVIRKAKCDTVITIGKIATATAVENIRASSAATAGNGLMVATIWPRNRNSGAIAIQRIEAMRAAL